MKSRSNKQREHLTSKQIWRNPTYFLAFGFGLGLFPTMPGTIGTLGAIPLYLLMADLEPWIYLTICCVLFIYGIYICTIAEKDFGVKDNPGIVWDEIVGFLVALCIIPFSVAWGIYAFIIFRLLDIFKPWPINILEERTSGGFAIMIDDLVAGIVTLVIVWFSTLVI